MVILSRQWDGKVRLQCVQLPYSILRLFILLLFLALALFIHSRDKCSSCYAYVSCLRTGRLVVSE